MWNGLRCRTLHNFSAQGILLADSQSESSLHLRVHQSDVVLHWPEFFDDYKNALDAYWAALLVDADLQRKAERRCGQYPPLMVKKIEISDSAFRFAFRPHSAALRARTAGPRSALAPEPATTSRASGLERERPAGRPPDSPRTPTRRS
jgi:hypothetical protein